MQWRPGYRLKNRPYEIEKELGEGGFGITYKAKHLNFDIPVVIKTPNSKLQKDTNYPKFVESFRREGKQLAKIGLNRHPHIVRVSDFFNEDNLPCIVMDFIEGKNLYDLVLTQGKLSEETAVKYIKQIASALTTCHNAGIIHRDVSPLNIIISYQTGDTILIDFGISMSLQTTRYTYSGNRCFAPWEQMAHWEQQNSKTPQVDIYALAATLYFLVTGQVPLECLARKYNNEELIEPKKLSSNLSVAINNMILKGMEILPENRPSSVYKLIELLFSHPKRKKQSENLSAPKLNNYQNIKKKHRNKSVNKAIAASLAMLISIAGIYATVNKDESFKTFPLNLDFISSIVIDSTGKLLASSSILDNTIKILDMEAKQEVATLNSDFLSIQSLAFQPENSMLVSASSYSGGVGYEGFTRLQLWDIYNKHTIDDISIDGYSLNSIAFSPDGKILVTGGSKTNNNNTIMLWDIKNKQEVATLGDCSYITTVAFSPDGTVLASACLSKNTVTLWNTKAKQKIATLIGHSRNVTSVAFSPDGTILASGSNDNTIRLWNVKTGKEITTITGHAGGISSLVFSPDGNTLASSSSDETVIKLWNVEARKQIAVLTGHKNGITSLIFSPISSSEGQILASGAKDGIVKLWRISHSLQ